MQLSFYFDQSRCIGCFTCAVACKDWNDVPAGPASWRRVSITEDGKYPHPVVTFLSSACYHCVKPVCMSACPVDAISKRNEDGIVVVDRVKCLGGESCGMRCRKACFYKAPQFGEEKDDKMQKCDFCLERWGEGKLPICVASCPTRALDAGPLEEMEAKYGINHKALGFVYKDKLQPSIILKSKA